MKTLLNKKLIISFTAAVICIVISTAHAQNKFPSTGAVGIGTTTPDASSLLEIKSTTKGLLIPRMTLAQRNAITTPATGLLIYQTNSTPGFYYYNGSSWNPFKYTAGTGISISNNTITNTAPDKIVTLAGSGGTTVSGTYPNFTISSSSSGGNYYLSTTTQNTSVGYQSFYSNQSGSGNTSTGIYSLYSNTSGSSNTATGHQALFSNDVGNNNAAYGESSLYSSESGSYNAAFGSGSLFENSAGNYNTALGYESFLKNGSGTANTGTGAYSLYNNLGDDNTANGYKALYSNTSGFDNTATGTEALYSNTTGTSNTATGFQSLYYNNGIDNTANGVNALFSNSSGSYNTASGTEALYSNSASNNTAFGYSALSGNTSGDGNTAIGEGSLAAGSGTGYQNSAVGYQSLYNNSSNYNVGVGTQTLYHNTSGASNVAVGCFAGTARDGLGYCTFVGYGADAMSNSLNNASAFGFGAIVNANNKIRLGNAGITVVESNAGFWSTSDGRFKTNIKENVKGLEFIKLLRPVTYNFDAQKFEEFLLQNYPDSIKQKRLAEMDKDAMKKTTAKIQSGFIAQEVADAVKKSGYDFNGVHAPESSSDNWSLSYEKLTVPLVKAVQELSAMNDAKDARIDTLQNQLNDLKTLVLFIQQQQQSCSPCNAANNTSATQSYAVITDGASLEQNIPNPFNSTTKINYSLPQKYASAYLLITDKSGKTLKQINVSGSGKGSLYVDASTLSSGAYQYSLIVDGRLIDTKQMVLAR